MKKYYLAGAVCAVSMLTSCGMLNSFMNVNKNPTPNPDETTYESQADPEPDDSQPETDPDELYDTKPISEAYLSGDVSGLDDFQKDIYDLASAVIDSVITSEMSDYEKELAIHDYIVENVAYDENMLGVFETHGVNAVNPYGALKEKTCICSGYTTTFQMFMDMLEIPCISIKAGDVSGEEHAWSMVEINGRHYYVDVTWDDPVPEREARLTRHKYFNITEEYMAEKYVWDSENYPVADSYEDSYIAHNLYEISDWGELIPLLEKQAESGSENLYLLPSEELGADLSEHEGIDSYAGKHMISTEMWDKIGEFLKENREYYINVQRVKYDNQNVIAIYLTL